MQQLLLNPRVKIPINAGDEEEVDEAEAAEEDGTNQEDLEVVGAGILAGLLEVGGDKEGGNDDARSQIALEKSL
eukprot:scaffold5281_cov127-Cylindrotheca_fusiformis.AAC.1